MKQIVKTLLIIVTFGFYSCEEVAKIIEDTSLTNDEIVEGLKTALTVGTDTAVFSSSAVDGYYADALLKIRLPKEANLIVENISKISEGATLLENVLLRINRSAEDAATEAKPIFVDAITNMSISDGLAILQGKNPLAKSFSTEFDSTAATQYLKTTTYNSLVAAFSPKINASLDKKLVGNISTNEAWSNLTTVYNIFALVNNKDKVNTSLGEHVTQKALDGLFLKVGAEERKIRQNPFKWASDILKKVFGSVME